jgi:hypothetical protein
MHLSSNRIEHVCNTGFFAYFIPFAILRRRIAAQLSRRSLSVAVFVATIRFADRILALRKTKISSSTLMSSSTSTAASLDSSAAKAAGQQDGTAARTSSAGNVNVFKPDRWDWDAISAVLRKYRHAIGGGAAAVAALSVDPTIHNSLFVLWTLVRAIRAVYPAELEFKGLPILMLCLASSQILRCVGGSRASLLAFVGLYPPTDSITYQSLVGHHFKPSLHLHLHVRCVNCCSSWIAACDELDPIYLKFLDHHGGQSKGLRPTSARPRTIIAPVCHQAIR